MRITRITAVATAIAGLALATTLQGQQQTRASQAAGTAGALKWGPAPAVLPAGAQMAVVKGDPSKAGPFTVALSMPDGYRIPPHFHPTEEQLVIRRGTFRVGMGDTFDAANTKPMSAGASGAMPANMHHYAVTKGRTVINISGEGPFAMTYVNPADDPRGPTPTP